MASTSTSNLNLSSNKGRFVPTVTLTKPVQKALLSGKAQLRTGQWVFDPSTRQTGQFKKIAKSRLGIKKIAVRAAMPGMSFADYQRGVA